MRNQSEGLAESDEITRFDELESCLFEVMFSPTPRDLFLQELATCPGGATPDAAEATPEEQQAVIECARGIFQGDDLPDEILTGMAACLGVELDALASVTDNDALITCGVEVIAAPPPVQEDAAVEEFTEESATSPPVPTSVVVGEG